MKTKSLLTVFFILGTSIYGLLLISCDRPSSTNLETDNKPAPEKVVPSIQVSNEFVESDILLEGKIDYRSVKDVSFSVGGILEAGDITMKTGLEFKFNTLLFKLNLKDAFGLLSARKKDLARLFEDYQQSLKALSPKDIEKWKTFISAISPAKRLPDLPVFKTEEEKNLLIEKNLFVRYDEVQQLEDEIESYFSLAPFDGKVLSVNAKIGDRIKPNQVLARIAKLGEYKIKARVNLEQANPSSPIELLNASKKTIGKAILLSAKKVGDQKELSFSIILNKNVRTEIGQKFYLKTTLKNQKACYLAKDAVKDSHVYIWKNGMKQKKRVLVLKEEENRCLVSGLGDGEVVLLEK